VASGSFSLSGGIVDYAGVSITPLDGTASSGAASGNAACTGFSTTTANDEVIVAAANNNNVTFAPPAGMTERLDLATTRASMEHSDVLQGTAGATNTKTATPSNTTAGWACEMLALKPSTGNLTLTVPGTPPSFSLALTGVDQTTTYTPSLSVTDTRTSPPAPGWNLQITSSQFSAAGGKTLATSASTVTAVSRVCNTGSTCGTLPTNNVTYPLAVPAGAGPPTAVKLYNAASATGSGIVAVTPTVQVAVPGNASTGSYTSTLTLTVATGP
jgi:putative surface cell wall-binding protein